MPKHVTNWLINDAHAILWDRKLTILPDDTGTESTARPFMSAGAAMRSRASLGVSALHWPSHVKAIQAQIMLHYLNGSRSSWKYVLDEWYARTPQGRGVIFSTTPTPGITTSTTRRTAALPAIFKQALYSFRELPFEKSSPGEFISKDEALAEPAWCSHLFTLKNTDYYQTWRVQAEFNRVQDFVHDNKVWTDEQIIDYFTRKFESDYRGHIKVKGRIPIAPGILTKQWRSLVKDCPDYVLNWATGKASTAADHTPSYSEIATKLMRMMGHVEGNGLGPSGSGLTELECWKVTKPPKPREGLGFKPKSKAKAKPKPTVVCFNDPALPAGRDP